MKKNGIAIDIIDFGTENRGNTEILSHLIDSVDSESHPSRLITIEQNSGNFLLDSLRSKVPELFNLNGSSGQNGGTDGFDFDPEMDPELAMALKLSMEEEINRQKQQQANNGDADSKNMEKDAIVNENANENEDEDEELMLARAIALSMEQSKNNEKQ